MLKRYKETDTGYPNTETGDMKNQIGDPHTYSRDIKKQTTWDMKKQTGDPHTYPGDTKKQTQEIKLRDHMRYKETDT